MVAARHAHIAEDKLWEEGEIKANKDQTAGHLGPELVIHSASDLWPPVVNPCHVTHDCATHHYIVEVRHHEVGIGYMDVEAHSGQEETSEATDRKQANETNGVKHRGREPDLALIHGRGPVEDLNGRGNGHDVGEDREHHTRIGRLAGNEQVMAPNQEPEDGNRNRGKRNKGVTKCIIKGKGLRKTVGLP